MWWWGLCEEGRIEWVWSEQGSEGWSKLAYHAVHARMQPRLARGPRSPLRTCSMQATTDNGKASEAHGEQAAQMAGTPPTMPMKRKADEQVGAEDGIDAGEQASPAVQPAAKKGKGKAVAEADGSNATTEETATSLKAPAVKGKKKKAATRKGKKKVSAQASGSSTPREASVQENGGGDVSGEEDLEKLYCLCRTPFGECHRPSLHITVLNESIRSR